MDILEDLRTTTFSNNEAFFKKAACEIEQLRTENAALKEQVTHLKSSVQHEADCVDSAAVEINRQAAENDKLKETIAQQAEAIRLKDVALEKIACIGNGDTHGNSIGNCLAIDALAIQPSTDILQTRDDKVAEAFEKYKAKTIFPESVCEVDFRAGYLALLNSLELSDWVRDSDNASLYALPEGVEK